MQDQPAGYFHGKEQSDWALAPRIGMRAGWSTWVLAILALGWMILLAACSGDPGSGPVEVKWDRLACERCRMVLSDRKHSAQVRMPRPDGKSRVLFFDDIGCALLWLEGRPRADRESPSTEIWVTDWRTGDWLDARSATYVPGQVTPMEYGLGAQLEPTAGGMDFARAKEHLFEVERRLNVPGAHQDATAGGRATNPER